LLLFITLQERKTALAQYSVRCQAVIGLSHTSRILMSQQGFLNKVCSILLTSGPDTYANASDCKPSFNEF